MAKTRISSSDLVWIFTEKLRSFDECSPGTNIAIVPSEDGWTAVTGGRRRGQHRRCDRRIEQIQKQLREIYVLARDWYSVGRRRRTSTRYRPGNRPSV